MISIKEKPKQKKQKKTTQTSGEKTKKSWQLPTLPRTSRSTIGVRAFYFRVRDGNGYFHSAMATSRTAGPEVSSPIREPDGQYGQASRLISNGQLNMLPCLHCHPINRVVFPGSSEGLNP